MIALAHIVAPAREGSVPLTDASSLAPRLTGSISVDTLAGIVRANLCLDDLPKGVRSFAINRGMNVREFRAKDSGELIDFQIDPTSEVAGDAVRYLLPPDLPKQGICTTYSGAYPVYVIANGERSVDDWKGSITFNGRSIRAADQSRFYPAPVMPAGNERGELRYALEIACFTCRTIFWSGSPPADGPTAFFVSETPRNLFLYAGDFPATRVDGASFVGVSIDPRDAAEFSEAIKRVAEAHESYMGVPYSDSPSFVSFASVGRKRDPDRTTWQFVTWPTIAADGMMPFSNFIDRAAGRGRLKPGIEKVLSHEMAHYYFGTLYQPRGPLLWFLLESTAEFMSLKAIKLLRDETSYTSKLGEYGREIARRNDFVPLDRIKKSDEVDDDYRYKLGPLLWVGLEKWTGERTVQHTLIRLVKDRPAGPIDYKTLRIRLTEAGATESDMARFERNCLVQEVLPGCWN